MPGRIGSRMVSHCLVDSVLETKYIGTHKPLLSSKHIHVFHTLMSFIHSCLSYIDVNSTWQLGRPSTFAAQLQTSVGLTHVCITVMTTKHERISCNHARANTNWKFKNQLSQTSCLSTSHKKSKSTNVTFRHKLQKHKTKNQISKVESLATKVLVKVKVPIFVRQKSDFKNSAATNLPLKVAHTQRHTDQSHKT